MLFFYFLLFLLSSSASFSSSSSSSLIKLPFPSSFFRFALATKMGSLGEASRPHLRVIRPGDHSPPRTSSPESPSPTSAASSSSSSSSPRDSQLAGDPVGFSSPMIVVAADGPSPHAYALDSAAIDAESSCPRWCPLPRQPGPEDGPCHRRPPPVHQLSPIEIPRQLNDTGGKTISTLDSQPSSRSNVFLVHFESDYYTGSVCFAPGVPGRPCFRPLGGRCHLRRVWAIPCLPFHPHHPDPPQLSRKTRTKCFSSTNETSSPG